MTKKDYFNYLKSRSKLSYIYRNYYLYPKLKRIYSNRKTLDFGCGIGDLLSFDRKVIGVDINSSMIQYCKDKNLNAHLIKNNTLPFFDSEFECIILDNVLEHIEEPNLLFIEIKRTLSENGILIIGVPGIKGYGYDLDHKKFYDIRGVKKLSHIHQFKLIDYFYTPFNLNFFSKIIRQHCLYCVLKYNE